MPAILQNIVKFSVLAAIGFLITTALFLLMQGLIHQEFASPDRGTSVDIAAITMPDLVIEVVRRHPVPEKIEMVEPPELKFVDVIDIARLGGDGFHFDKSVVPTIDGTEAGLGNFDTNAMPLVQVQPTYPTRAVQRGIEGYVVVEFDVDEKGSVINPRVLYAEPEGYFEEAALRALERYRYQPKVMNGNEVKMLGVQQKFTFTLDE